MAVLYSRTYTAASSGAVVRHVRCERCGVEYFYKLRRYSKSQTSSPYGLNNRRAAEDAQITATRELEKKLRYGVDPVACPDCGWYQAHMVQEIHRRKLGWLRTIAAVSCIVIPAIVLCWMPISTGGFRIPTQGEWVFLSGLAGAAFVLIVIPSQLRRFVMTMRDPNRRFPEKPKPYPGAPTPFKAVPTTAESDPPEAG